MTAAVPPPAPAASASAAPIPALTSLRFIAALAVVVLHYRDLIGPLPPWLLKLIVGGQYGVTFFFVLSGFILTYQYQHWFERGVSDTGYWRFQRFRIARIYPVYLLGLLLDTPWHLIERAQADQLAAEGISYWASWLINLVGLQAWVPAVPFAMFWNTPAWSVAAELFFYAGFPFVTYRLARWGGSPRRLLAGLLAVVLLGTLAYALLIHAMTYRWHTAPQTQYLLTVYNPLLRYSEFLAGCLTGQYFLRTRGLARYAGSWLLERRRARGSAIALCLLLIALRVAWPDYSGPSAWCWLADVSIKYSVFILPFALLIVALASGPSWLGVLLEMPGLVLLGEASYALYMIHWPVTTFLRMGYLGALAGPWVHGLFLLATVALSLACYRWFEVPWRRRLRGPALPRQGLSTPYALA